MLDLNRGIASYLRTETISFHTPGHKGRTEFFQNLCFPAGDLTELPDLDQLHHPHGVLKLAQQRAAEVFGAEESFFLINGATAGNQAMLMALETEKSGRVLVERQGHRSVMAGLILSGLTPEYFRPVWHPDFALMLGCDTGQCSLHRKDLLACHFTYPGYYGAVVNLPEILTIRDGVVPTLPVLIDQAHGAHYLSGLFPPSAVQLGADLVLQSTHKTLSALTQAAMLHRQGANIQAWRLKQALEILQSSSPSYLLMASLESAVEFAQQEWRWEALREEVAKIHQTATGSLRLLGPQDVGQYGIWKTDWSKILVNTRYLGVTAGYCAQYLRRRFCIEPEFWDEENILFVLGIGNTPEDLRMLRQGLESLQNKEFLTYVPSEERINTIKHQRFIRSQEAFNSAPYPPLRLTPREAYATVKREVPLRESKGKICGETISPYPPGIPLVMMGEEITGEIVELLNQGQTRTWQGWQGAETQMIRIID